MKNGGGDSGGRLGHLIYMEPAMPATVRILIVEDDPQDAALAEREVRRADIFCTFRRVETRDGMAEALREFVPDVILTDHSLPAFDARGALQLGQQLSPGTPVIVVTGRLADESAVEYLQAGAADYIVKDHLHRLGPAVLRALDTKHSREAQARAHQLQAATYRIAQVAMSTPGLEGLLPATHRIVSELMPARNFYIALYDPANDLLSFPYVVDEHDTDFSSKKPGKGLTEHVLRTGQALLVTPEVQAELEQRGEVELVGTPSIDWLGVPLKIGDRTIGVLVVQTYAPGVRYGQREKEILQFVSTQVAMAIERSHAEADLRASEARLKAIIDAALDAVITMDGDGVVLSWSPQAERVFGWPASEVVGRTLSTTIIPPRYRDAHERGLARFLASGEGPVLNQRIEITGLRRDGREIPVELTITPVRLVGAGAPGDDLRAGHRTPRRSVGKQRTDLASRCYQAAGLAVPPTAPRDCCGCSRRVRFSDPERDGHHRRNRVLQPRLARARPRSARNGGCARESDRAVHRA